MPQMTAGPSSGRRRRAPERASDIAELYARLTAVESETRQFKEETFERLTEVEQDVDRVASDGRIQGEFLTQNLAKVQGQAQAAYRQGEATQAQLDSMRQQTEAITETMRSFDENSRRMNDFMGGLMTRLERIRFDIGNSIDTWGSIRFGSIPGAPSTVQANELHQAQLPWLKPDSEPIRARHTPPLTLTSPPRHPKISSTESSPSKVAWGEYILTQSTDHGERIFEDMDVDSGEVHLSDEATCQMTEPMKEKDSVLAVGEEELNVVEVREDVSERRDEEEGSGTVKEQGEPGGVSSGASGSDKGDRIILSRQLSDIEEVPEPLPSPSSADEAMRRSCSD